MASNKLFEAAAEILAGSKSSSPAMPPEKLAAEVENLGGPTPENYKSDDDSAKLATSKSAKTAVAPTTKPSAASAKMEEVENYSLEELKEFMVSEEFEQLDELSKNTLRSYLKGSKRENDPRIHGDSAGAHSQMSDKARSLGRTEQDKEDGRYEGAKAAKKRLNAMKEDIDALFADDSTISEEFKSKVSTIFEARVMDRVTQIEEETESRYAGMLEEAVESIKQDLTEKVDDYLSYVVEQWMEENQIAIESGLRSEMTEEFIAGLRNLFAEHYIDVPAEKVDVVEELASKVEELESQLNEEIDRAVQLNKALIESYKTELTREVCNGLTETQVEKIKSLAESVAFTSEDEYKEKLETIRENYFPSGVKKANVNQLHEEVTDGTENKQVSADPYVAAVMNAISKTNKI
jgi:hypothetical protein